MGKRRNRKKKTLYRAVDAGTCMGFSSSNGEHHGDRRSLRSKAKTKSPGYDEMMCNTASEREALVGSVLPLNSAGSAFSRDMKGSCWKRNAQQDNRTRVRKDCVVGTRTSSSPGRDGKCSPMFQPLKGEEKSLQKGKKSANLASGRDTKNMPKDIKKDVPQAGLAIKDTHGKPSVTCNYTTGVKSGVELDSYAQIVQKKRATYANTDDGSQISKTERNSVQRPANVIKSSHDVNSSHACVLVKPFSEVQILEEVSRLGPVTAKSGPQDKKIPAKTTVTCQLIAKNIKQAPKSENKSFWNGSGCDVKDTSCDVGSVRGDHVMKNYFKSQVPPKSKDKVNWPLSNSVYALGNTGNPAEKPGRHFQKALNRWLPVRNESICKLQKLLDRALQSEAAHNSLQLMCRHGSVKCKVQKIVAPTWTWDLVSSLGSMACDMAGGLTSVIHMFKTDGIQCQFQEIMDEDAAATKKMYEARSKYVAEYHYTDEIIRKFGGTTLGETLWKISESIGITEFYQQMKKANDNREDFPLVAIVGSMMNRFCTRDVGREVVDAVQELVDNNPACVGTVTGVGKSLYGAADLRMIPVKRAGKVGQLVKAGTKLIDCELMSQDLAAIAELEHKMQDCSQSAVAKRIGEALDVFIQEKEEMLDLVRKL